MAVDHFAAAGVFAAVGNFAAAGHFAAVDNFAGLIILWLWLDGPKRMLNLCSRQATVVARFFLILFLMTLIVVVVVVVIHVARHSDCCMGTGTIGTIP